MEAVKEQMRLDMVLKKNQKVTINDDQAKKYSDIHNDMTKTPEETKKAQGEILKGLKVEKIGFVEKLRMAASSLGKGGRE